MSGVRLAFLVNMSPLRNPASLCRSVSLKLDTLPRRIIPQAVRMWRRRGGGVVAEWGRRLRGWQSARWLLVYSGILDPFHPLYYFVCDAAATYMTCITRKKKSLEWESLNSLRTLRCTTEQIIVKIVPRFRLICILLYVFLAHEC